LLMVREKWKSRNLFWAAAREVRRLWRDLVVFRDACEDSAGRWMAPIAEGKGRKWVAARHAGDKVTAGLGILQGLGASVAGDWFCSMAVVRIGPLPQGVLFGAKYSEEKGWVWTFLFGFAVKDEGPAFGRALFSVFYLPLILSNGEKLNSSFGGFIFWLAGGWFWAVYGFFWWWFLGAGGLTCEFGGFLEVSDRFSVGMNKYINQ
jgi:hypothetical protein